MTRMSEPKCATPGCDGHAIYEGLCMRCDAVNPFEEGPPRETCGHCGKELDDFSDLGCEHCDRRHPDFGTV